MNLWYGGHASDPPLSLQKKKKREKVNKHSKSYFFSLKDISYKDFEFY